MANRGSSRWYSTNRDGVVKPDRSPDMVSRWRRPICALRGAWPSPNAKSSSRDWRNVSSAASDAASTLSHREKGIEFESRVQRVMGALNCILVPTQTSMDGGIDHTGDWILPDVAIEVVTQCKNEHKPVGVQHLREFYGVLGLHASPTTLAIFFSSSGFSIYAQRFFARTLHPAVLCTITDEDRIVEFSLNDRARAALPKLSVGSCFVDHEHELILTYGDHVLGS